MDTEAKHQEPQLITPGTIARELDQPIHRVLHVLATRPTILPTARAGRIRLYDRVAFELVRCEIDRIDAFHTVRKGGAV